MSKNLLKWRLENKGRELKDRRTVLVNRYRDPWLSQNQELVEEFQRTLLSNENYAAYEDFVYKLDLAGQLFANTSPEHKNELLSRYYELKASGQCRPGVHGPNSATDSANGGLARKFSKYFDLINSGESFWRN